MRRLLGGVAKWLDLGSFLWFFVHSNTKTGLLAEPQVCGVGGLAARHDRQRVGLARPSQSRLQQSVVQSQSRLVRRERLLLRHRRQPPRQILVPRVLAIGQSEFDQVSSCFESNLVMVWFLGQVVIMRRFRCSTRR